MFWDVSLHLAAGIACRSAARASRWAEFDTGADTESISQKVDFNRFGLFKEIFIHNKLESVYIVYVISIFWLVQSHCQ